MMVFDQLKKGDPQLRLLTWVVLCGLAVLGVGLWWVQVVSANRFREREQTQSFRTVRIPATRGKILDRKGIALAENRPSYNLSLYLEELRPLFGKEFDRIRPMRETAGSGPFWRRWLGMETAKAVPAKLRPEDRAALSAQARYSVASNVLSKVSADLREPVEIKPATLARHYSGSLVLPLPFMFGLTPQQIARVEEQGNPPPGVSVEIQPQRFYPFHTTACHVLGYLQSDDSSAAGEPAVRYRLQDYRGVVGIEGAFDDDLRGVAGEKAVLVNNLGYRQSENVWSPAEPGRNVVLTLDVPTQQAAERALRSLGAETRGAIVVMDPNSGDIYAMASAPAFDPNVWLSPISTNDYEALNDPKLRPQINRAVQGYYPPGSIFKVVTSLALLENGLRPEENFTVEPNPKNPARGGIFVGKRLIGDTVSPGEYNFRRAFAKSSNSYFIHNGLQMRNGLDEILRMAQMLHLGERTGLPTRQEVPGSVPTRERRSKNGIAGWTDGDTANVCIGQGPVTVTPLQMAVMISAIANGGTVFWPRLVSRTEPQDPLDDSPIRTVAQGRVRDTLHVSRRTLDLIRDGMLADVEDPEGTGRRADVPGWNLCGKTGSAEVQKGNVTVDRITWFASYAPYESPRYVVVVMVESGSSGGLTCAPLARQVYTALQKQEKSSTPRRGPGSASQAAPAFSGLAGVPGDKSSNAR